MRNQRIRHHSARNITHGRRSRPCVAGTHLEGETNLRLNRPERLRARGRAKTRGGRLEPRGIHTAVGQELRIPDRLVRGTDQLQLGHAGVVDHGVQRVVHLGPELGRPAFTELLIFLIPFAVYALFLLTTRSGVTLPASWPAHVIAKVVVGSLLLVILSFVLLAHFSGASPNSTYIPAHIENGKFVPGVEK